MTGTLYVFSGAGISAESGISTFRDSNGLWENHKIEEICNINTWKKNREKVFDFYNQRRVQLAEVKPNKIHLKLAELEKEIEVIHLTQNVDDLLERAGCSKVIHLHGELTKMMCTCCATTNQTDLNLNEFTTWEVGYNSINSEEIRCPNCNSNKGVKPYIVFFGEFAPNYHLKKRIFRDIKQNDMVLVLGTNGNVIPIYRDLQFVYGLKILNNLEKNEYIGEDIFDRVFYKPGTEAIDEICKIALKYLK